MCYARCDNSLNSGLISMILLRNNTENMKKVNKQYNFKHLN